MRRQVVGLLLLTAAGPVGAAPLQRLALHIAVRADRAPVLDGRLDEACWKAAPAFTQYIRGYGSNYQDTSIRIVWTDAGITFGVVNSEKDLRRLKVSVRSRDGGYVWADDSAEIYLDPTATGYTVFKFDVNCIGTIGDFWQVDPGFTDISWSASSAKAACGRTADAWTIEFFISWADLKKTAHACDVWMMMHQRFSYTAADGHRCAVSTSGGNWYNRRFGYIFFVDKQLPTQRQIGQKLLKTARAPWVLPLEGKWLYAADRRVDDLTTAAAVARLRASAKASLDAVAKVLKRAPDPSTQKQLDALRKRFDGAVPGAGIDGAFTAMKTLHEITGAASEVRDEALLAEMLN